MSYQAHSYRRRRDVVVAVAINDVNGESHDDITRQVVDGVGGTGPSSHPSTTAPGGSNNSNQRYPYPFHQYPYHHAVAMGVEAVEALSVVELTASLRIRSHARELEEGICHADAMYAPVPGLVYEPRSSPLTHAEQDDVALSIPSTNNTDNSGSSSSNASVNHNNGIPLAIAVPLYGRSQY